MASERKINGVIYRFEPLVGWEEWDAMQRLTRLAARFSGLIEAVAEPDDRRTVAIARAIPGIVSGFDDAEFRGFADLLLGNCRADGDPVVVGVKPQRLDVLLQVIVFMVEAQFSGFFGGTFASWIAEAVRKANEKAEQEAA